MGLQSSKNSIEFGLTQMAEVTTTNSQFCGGKTVQEQLVVIKGSTGVTVNADDWKQMAKSMTKCAADYKNSSKLGQDMKAATEQMAKNASSMVPSATSQSAENSTKIAMMMYGAVVTSSSQVCQPTIEQMQATLVTDATNSTINVNNWSQIAENTVDCTITASTVADVQQLLDVAVKQSADNSQETLTGVLTMLIILAVVAVGGVALLTTMTGGKAVEKLLDWPSILIFSVLTVLLIGAYMMQQEDSQKRADEISVQNLKDTNVTIDTWCDEAIAAVDAIVLSKRYDPAQGDYWKFNETATPPTYGPYVPPNKNDGTDNQKDRTGEDASSLDFTVEANKKYEGFVRSRIRRHCDRLGCIYDNTETDESICTRAKPYNLKLWAQKVKAGDPNEVI